MSYRHENEDRLSSLPEEVLSHILSSMPTNFAVRTSTLSKRWRYNWTLITNLDFDDDHPFHGLHCFLNFVNRVLTLCKTSKIKRFRLCFSYGGVRTTSDLKSNMSKWIHEAVRLNVCEVDLNVTPFELPLSLFTCKTLTKLSLAGWGLEEFIGPSVVVILPLLKTLHITVPGVVYVNAFRLIRGSPMLENLSLEIGLCNEQEDYNFNIPTLKRLKLSIIGYISINKVILNVPNLEYFSVFGLLSSLFVIEDLSSLVEATVDLGPGQKITNHLYAELLKGISGAKSLSWSSPTLDVLLKSPLPKFPNLKHLELIGSLHSRSWLLFQRLESCSKLEHLCFEEPKESCWIEPQSVPTWMLTNLRTMKITRCKGRDCDLQFIEYVLGNSEVLKMLTIKCKSLLMEDEMRLCAHLLTFPRASRHCQIQFVGKWILNIF